MRPWFPAGISHDRPGCRGKEKGYSRAQQRILSSFHIQQKKVRMAWRYLLKHSFCRFLPTVLFWDYFLRTSCGDDPLLFSCCPYVPHPREHVNVPFNSVMRFSSRTWLDWQSPKLIHFFPLCFIFYLSGRKTETDPPVELYFRVVPSVNCSTALVSTSLVFKISSLVKKIIQVRIPRTVAKRKRIYKCFLTVGKSVFQTWVMCQTQPKVFISLKFDARVQIHTGKSSCGSSASWSWVHKRFQGKTKVHPSLVTKTVLGSKVHSEGCEWVLFLSITV